MRGIGRVDGRPMGNPARLKLQSVARLLQRFGRGIPISGMSPTCYDTRNTRARTRPALTPPRRGAQPVYSRWKMHCCRVLVGKSPSAV